MSDEEGNPINDIIRVFTALFKQYESDSARILSEIRSIFASKSISKIFIYFCLHGAATAWELQRELNMAEATTYRALSHLKSLGFITPALRVSKFRHSKGGPRPIVWAIEGASQEEIARAYQEMRQYAV